MVGSAKSVEESGAVADAADIRTIEKSRMPMKTPGSTGYTLIFDCCALRKKSAISAFTQASRVGNTGNVGVTKRMALRMLGAPSSESAIRSSSSTEPAPGAYWQMIFELNGGGILFWMFVNAARRSDRSAANACAVVLRTR